MFRNYQGAYISSIILIISVLLLSGCGSGGVNCDKFTLGNDLFESEISDVTGAAIFFNGNPTPKNCENLLKAYTTYIDKLKDYVVCADELGQGQDLRDFIADAEASKSNLDCGN